MTNANYGSDGGDLLAAILTNGIPHPSGYPSYVLLGNIFQLIPLSTPVFRAVLESLVPTALSAGLLTIWLVHVIRHNSIAGIFAAALAGITMGIAPLIFSQAVIVEVHGLQLLIVTLFLWWVLLNLDPKQEANNRWLFLLSLLLGLGLGNHLTLLLLAPAALLVFILMIRNSKAWRQVIAQIILVCAGVLIYFALPVRAQAYPAINWGNPRTWSGFLWEITGSPYHGLFLGASASTLLDRLRSISSLFLDQFGALGLVAGVIGVIQHPFRIKWLRWILVWTFFIYIAFAISYTSNDSFGYLIPAILVFAVWIGLSIPALSKLYIRRFPIGAPLIAILAISILVRIPTTRIRLDPRMQDQPARYAEQFLSEAPSGAIVYTTSDQDSFPLWYYHFGLHQRPDLHIIVLPLTQFVWYQQTLTHIYPDLQYPQIYIEDLPSVEWGQQIALLNSQHPVCNTQLSAELLGVTYQCSHP